MATSYAHQFAFNEARTAAHDAQLATAGLGARFLVWMRQLYCGLHGHDSLMQFAQDRMFMQCSSCGHETPGWMLTEARPKVVIRGDSRRHALMRPRLVDARRIA